MALPKLMWPPSLPPNSARLVDLSYKAKNTTWDNALCVKPLRNLEIKNLQKMMTLASYLIFVNSINSSANVKKLTESNFSQLTRKGLLTVPYYTVCYFTKNV